MNKPIDPIKPDRPIYVTKPQLPPLGEFVTLLEEIWASRVLTNGGPFHVQLEKELCDHLGVQHISLFANATVALITAFQALRVTGEVITTPYSFVATAHSLLWNGIRPVFVDIDPHTFNIDPKKIEAAITPQTTAILAVHCYGRSCDVAALQGIADAYGLKLIYDAAHAFDVRDVHGSILIHGDLSVLSFHATKVFNTFEGGAIICADSKMKARIDNLKNFGFLDEVTVVAPGINGKMSELNAALGILQLRRIEDAIARRAEIDKLYRNAILNLSGLRVLSPQHGILPNYAYFPVLVKSEFPVGRDELYTYLKTENIYARRYFYPLITEFPMYRGMPSAAPSNLPVATQISREILCLPIYPDLTRSEQARVILALTNAA